MLLFKRVCFEKGKKKLKVNIKDYKESYLGPCQTTKMEHKKHIRKKEAAWENFEKGFVFDIVKVSFEMRSLTHRWKPQGHFFQASKMCRADLNPKFP